MAQNVDNAENILHVGVHLLAQKGYEATSTREIVEAAGVTKPMLYYYFGNKEGLCKAAIRRLSQKYFATLREKTGRVTESRQVLVEFVWAHFEFMREHQDEMLFHMSLFFGPERRRFADDFEIIVREAQVLGDEILAAMVAAGVLRRGCEEEFYRALHGTIDSWNRASIIEGIELTHALAERVVENLLNGFGVR